MRKATDLLSGTRVIELCWAWAGPLAARMLGDLGAEVIKIEGPSRPDGVRFGNYPDNDPGDEPWNRGGHFQKYSRNKKSLVLDLSRPAGRDVFLDLIAQSDVFIENNSPRVLPNLGLTYDVLHERNHHLVMVSMPGFGNSGPLRDWVAFGINLEAYCGLSSITGYRDVGPVRSVVPYGDPIAGLHAAVATLAALREARSTGQGQYIEVAQDESLVNVLVEPFFRSTLADEDITPDGCHHEFTAPHNVYRTSGDDEWICLVAETEAAFGALATLVGRSDWASDPSFASAFQRKAREDELDHWIGRWVVTKNRHEVLKLLAEAGVPAASAQRVDEIVSDPLLERRGYWTDVNHPVTGRLRYSYLPWRYWRSERTQPVHAPLFGEHNREILVETLGMTEAEVQRLEEEGILATRPNMG